MMKSHVLGVVFITVGLAACQDPQASTKRMLCADSVKNWDEVFPQFGRNPHILGGMSLHADGKIQYYSYENGRRVPARMSDVVPPSTWDCKGDSILLLGVAPVAIVHITDDMLAFQYSDTNVHILVDASITQRFGN